MTIRGKYFPSQEKEEKVFLLVRKHWFNYVVFFFLVLMALIPVIGVIIYFNLAEVILSSENIVFLITAFSVYFLVLMAIELYGFVDYYLDVYIVTDRRIVDISQKGFFRREISELHLRQVQDVSAHVRGVFETVLHFGDVFIQTAGERENFIFQSIPHPYTVAKQIVDLHEKQIGRRGVISVKNNYDEEQLEKGLSVQNIEREAKKLVDDKSVADKPDHGLYILKGSFDNTNIDDNPTTENNGGLISKPNVDEEGELKDGKEINLK